MVLVRKPVNAQDDQRARAICGFETQQITQASAEEKVGSFPESLVVLTAAMISRQVQHVRLADVLSWPGLRRYQNPVQYIFIWLFVIRNPSRVIQKTLARVMIVEVQFKKFLFRLEVLSENLQKDKVRPAIFRFVQRQR